MRECGHFMANVGIIPTLAIKQPHCYVILAVILFYKKYSQNEHINLYTYISLI